MRRRSPGNQPDHFLPHFIGQKDAQSTGQCHPRLGSWCPCPSRVAIDDSHYFGPLPESPGDA